MMTCMSNGIYTISTNATNLWYSVTESAELLCFSSITRNWTLVADSPQTTPPGEINFRVVCETENLTVAPDYDVVFNFGDEDTSDSQKFNSGAKLVDGKWEMSLLRNYAAKGLYNATINISSPYDFEAFSTEVMIYEKIGVLKVDTYFVKGGSYPVDKKPLVGMSNDSAPVGSTLFFECSITGYVTTYTASYSLDQMLIKIEDNSSSNILSYTFTESGMWKLTFIAWNPIDGFSNQVDVIVSIAPDVSGVQFEASSLVLSVEEHVEFTITLESFDILSCLIFDGDDQAEKIGFGNRATCMIKYPLGDYQWTERDPIKLAQGAISGRRRRETVSSEWTSLNVIKVIYQYGKEGDYKPSLQIFNHVNEAQKVLDILVTNGEYISPLVWIDENSTDIVNPIQRERGKEFRLETTAIFRDDESYSAIHRWTVYHIDDVGNILEEIDVTHLRTYNCSAIRIPQRFLEIGLYKFMYNLTVMLEEESNFVSYEPKLEKDEYGFTYYAEPDDEEEEPFPVESYENRTIIAYRITYTFLRIIPTPLIPMLIEGGASSVRRGFGQKVFLQPTKLSEDPDFPDERDFIVTWFCKKFGEELPRDGENYAPGTPSGPIIDRSVLKEEDNKGGCFGKGPGLAEIGTGDFELKTDMFWSSETKYEMIAVIRKKTKVTEGRLIIEVIDKLPPSIRVMCEKRIACFPQIEGQFINPNFWTPLQIECLEDCGPEGSLKFTWEIYASNINTWEKNEVKNWESHVIIDKDRMGINQSLFIENPAHKTYLIAVTAVLPDLPSGSSSIFLLLNTAPKGGVCKINSTSGQAMIDAFFVEFEGWYDEDGHNITDYSIYVDLGEDTIRLQYGIKKKFDIVLPFGDLKVWCSVEDSLGARTTQSVANFTTMLPTEEQMDLYDKKRVFDRSLAEGKMFTASQIIIARNTIIMKYKRLKNETDDFGDVSDAAIDAKWAEYLALDGIDSSYYTPQAREEITEELREKLEKIQDANAKKKSKEIEKLLRLPMDALPDVEIFGGALNSMVSNGPTNKKGKEKVIEGMWDMYNIMNASEVPHPESKKVALNQFGGIADTMAQSMSQGMIGGKFLPGEVKKAEEKLDYNVSEPNYFIYYVDGNKQEVKDRVKGRAVDATKGDQKDMAKGIAEGITEMVNSIQKSAMQDLMVGENPFITESEKGFQMTLVKKYAQELSGSEIHQGDASVTLPDICAILGQDDCKANGTAIGVQAVKWSTPLQAYGSGSGNLSSDSNVIQIELSGQDGAESISVNNTKEPFLICIPLSSSGSGEDQLEYVVPKLERDDDVLVYHSLPVDSPELGISIVFKPDDPESPFVILYKYGNKSALNDYDGVLTLGSMSSSNGVYTALIDSSVINEGGKEMYVGIGNLKSDIDPQSAFTIEKNATVVNMTNEFSSNYSIKISTAGCYYFDEKNEAWSSKGCKVKTISGKQTCCECNHLTSFASGLIVMPNKIDFEYVFANAGFHNNYTIYGTIIVTFSLFIIFLIFARWKDRKDLQKLGATPLPDNEQVDKYLYEILVFTGHQRNAGTKSNVFFIVSGEDDETEVRHVADDKRPIFKSSAVDVFVMAVPRCLGQLNYLRIWHDNSGKGKWGSWNVKYVVFRDVQTGQKFEFLINRWFAVEEDDGLIDRLIPVAGKEQSTEFSHVFSTASQRNLADRHLWFSVFLRPPRCRFTRVQRVSCCMAVLYLSMLVNAMYYQRTTPQPGAFKLGPLSLSPEEVVVGIISNLILFPPTFLMIFFFRKSRPRQLRPSRIEEALKQQRLDWKSKNPETIPEIPSEKLKGDEEMLLRRKKRKFSLPWWCIIFGWLCVIASIGVSIFFLWAYGISFGDEKTMNWLISLIISFFSSVLITQPVKILLMAIIVSCVCRSIDYDEDDADEDEEDPHLAKDEEFLHSGKRARRAAYRPMDLEALEEARKEREKEVKMYSVLREIGAYFFFLWVITFLSFGNRDPNSFFLREALINGFIKPGDLYVEFNNVNTEIKFWNWTYNALIPELFAFPWYNTRLPLGLRLYLDDRNNLKIGYAVLRQVRIKPKSCSVHWLMEDITPECAGFGSVFFEDGGVYTTGWKEVTSNNTPVPPEYKYLSASQLRGYPFWGQIDWYGGGGYVVPLISLSTRDSDIKKLKNKLEKLEKEGWINRHTRAVFVEFGVYNAQVNLFCAITIVAEFLPGGGIVPYFHMDPLRLLSYHTGFGLFQMAFEVLFVIFTIFFTVREFMHISKQGFSYFKEYWNVLEILSIMVSYCGIGLHIYKLVITYEILRIFNETEGTGYIKLQEAVLIDSIMCYQIGFIMSVSTLKFLKLLRFNRRIGVLSSTLRKCAEELQGYSVCLMVVFMAFVILFWLLLGRYVKEFSTFVYSFESSISMMLKKFNYEDMQAASPIFTPIAFFTFSLATAVVLINILLSIIIQSFEDVNHDTSQQSNEYQILDFFINRLKMTLGCGTAKVRPLPAIYRDKKKPLDTVASFPGKVDKLVEFINTVYFQDQVDFNSKEFLKKINVTQDQPGPNEPNRRERKKMVPKKVTKKSNIPKGIKKRFDDF